MKEPFRVLKPGGTVIIQTPFKEGDIYENEAIKSPEDRKIHFYQEDHVRIYSAGVLKSRLEKVCFQLKINVLKKIHFLNSKKERKYFLLKKQPD